MRATAQPWPKASGLNPKTPIRTRTARNARASRMETEGRVWLVGFFRRILAKSELDRKRSGGEMEFFWCKRPSYRGELTASAHYLPRFLSCVTTAFTGM